MEADGGSGSSQPAATSPLDAVAAPAGWSRTKIEAFLFFAAPVPKHAVSGKPAPPVANEGSSSSSSCSSSSQPCRRKPKSGSRRRWSEGDFLYYFEHACKPPLKKQRGSGPKALMMITQRYDDCYPGQATVPREDCDEEEAAEKVDPFLLRYGGRLRGGAASHEEAAGCTTGTSVAAKEVVVKAMTVFEGLLGGASFLPVFYLMKDGLHLGPVELSLTMGLSQLPWVLKPAIAIAVDQMPWQGSNRMPLLAAGAAVVAASFLGFTVLPSTYPIDVGLLTTTTFGRCLVSVVLQALLVEVARDSSGGNAGSSKVVGDFFLFGTGGALLGAFGSSFFVTQLGPNLTLRLLTTIPCIMLTTVGIYGVVSWTSGWNALGQQQQPIAGGPQRFVQQTMQPQTWRQKFAPVITDPFVWGPVLFLFVYNAGPSYDTSLFYFYTNALHFSPQSVGQLKVVQEVSKLAGIFLYRYYLRHVPDKYIMVGTTWLSIPLFMTPLILTTGAYERLHLDPRMLALSGELVREVCAHLQLMPAFARLVRVCPPGLEGTVGSLLVSVLNLSRAFSMASSASLLPMPMSNAIPSEPRNHCFEGGSQQDAAAAVREGFCRRQDEDENGAEDVQDGAS
eukprot:TRINITY_DN39699_c1_g1_i1.p1 TRINITY_DN39699_c1_g1~~TRINITY_DN39699_c1_g1_i1.p1  ORF type:complete len:642 (-),score=103.41 TRINITY_DN39699_c1_g1_i1:87-1943(-)